MSSARLSLFGPPHARCGGDSRKMVSKLLRDNFRYFDFSFFRFWILAIEDSDVSDDAYDFAFCSLRDLGGYFFFLFFELAEFYLDEFMIFQSEVRRTDKLIRHAFRADYYQWF